MRRHIAPTLLVTALLVLLGCSRTPAPVPVQASPAALADLAGRWEGEYHGDETGRSGSIVFTLAAGSDTAAGDVLMIPRSTGVPLRPAERANPQQRDDPAAPEVLTIRFVRVSGGEIRGELLPYRAPDCECTLETVFTGALQGDRITGTFTTYGAPGARPTGGRWEVKRQR
ncbi:MAG TPA: hypothetical protein VFS40_01525 [Gemmatimonadales bacterium]|nr:hypothetical protein [Gemmatimonadales bacterium]